jgi:hypothetical protein
MGDEVELYGCPICGAQPIAEVDGMTEEGNHRMSIGCFLDGHTVEVHGEYATIEEGDADLSSRWNKRPGERNRQLGVVVERLNEMVCLDPVAMDNVVDHRAACNDALVSSDALPCALSGGVPVVSGLGMLNGALGMIGDAWPLLAVFNDAEKLECFKLNAAHDTHTVQGAWRVFNYLCTSEMVHGDPYKKEDGEYVQFVYRDNLFVARLDESERELCVKSGLCMFWTQVGSPSLFTMYKACERLLGAGDLCGND